MWSVKMKKGLKWVALFLIDHHQTNGEYSRDKSLFVPVFP
jgi:hypothetical protein